MRNLKFRAWLKLGNLLLDNNWIGMNKLYFSGKSVIGIEDKEGELYSLEDIELMQFTGLKDKNNKDIYEGDIINTKDGKYTVKFSEDIACFEAIHRVGSVGLYGLMRRYPIEIIGNIHENPELII